MDFGSYPIRFISRLQAYLDDDVVHFGSRYSVLKIPRQAQGNGSRVCDQPFVHHSGPELW